MSKDRLLEISVVTAEALWVYAIVTVIIAATTAGSGPSAPAFVALALGGFYVARLTLHLEWPDTHLVALALVLTLLSLYAVLRLDYTGSLALYDLRWLGDFLGSPGDYVNTHSHQTLGLIAAGGLWLRSALRGRSQISREDITFSFSLGFAVILFAALLARAAEAEAKAVTGAALAFFGCGLFAFALSRITPAEQRASADFRRWWALVPVATVAAVLLMAIPAWLLAAAHIGEHLAPVGDALGWFLERAFYAILAPIIRAMEWVLRGIISLLAGDAQLERFQNQEALNFLEDLRRNEEQNRRTPEFLVIAGRTLFALVLAAPIAWLFYSAFRRLRRTTLHGDEFRERVTIEGEQDGPFGGRLGRLLSLLHWRGSGEPNLPEDVLAVRRLYLTMLERAARQGLHREPPGRTPLEFAPDLEQHFTSSVPGEISRAFTAARYGLRAPPRSELERMRQEWEKTVHS